MPTSAGAPGGARTTRRSWTLQTARGAVDVEVSAPEDAVLDDVLPALAAELGPPAGPLWSSSTELPGGTPLSIPELHHAAVLGWGRPAPRDPAAEGAGALELQVVGGPDAGRSLPLERGRLVVGRSSTCGLNLDDPDVSRRHAAVTVAEGRVTVADLGSSNGTVLTTRQGAVPLGSAETTWPVGEAIRLGATTLRLTGPAGSPLESRDTGAGRLVVRPLTGTPPPAVPVTVELPAPPADPPSRRLSWVAVSLPAVGGVAMAWLLDTPAFLFFALLSPAVAVAGWWSDRLAGRRAGRRARAEHAVALARAELELAAAVTADVAGQEERHPDVARLVAAARRRVSPLWSRGAHDPSAWVVRLGTGPGPTAVTVSGPDGGRSAAPADAVPVTLDLGSCGGLTLSGPRPAVLGTARALVCQLAALSPPGALSLELVCDPARLADWAWVRWLPQLGGVHPAGLSTGDRPDPSPTGGAGGDRGGDAGGRTLVVVDGPMNAEARAALVAGAPRVAVLELTDRPGSASGAHLTVTGETGSAGRLVLPGTPGRPITLDGVQETTAATLARTLAALTAPADGSGIPDSARLLELCAPPGQTGDEPTPDWDRSRTRLTATLGATARGPLTLDLVAQGPHALVAGTTGSGKSELLQTLVAGLALHHPPDRCSLLLVDYKGGAAFAEAAAMPHTVGVLTDLDHQSTARALRSLAAELTRRERLLAAHGARDVDGLPDEVALARLVIVVDEFATLVEDLPGFVSGLVGIAQRGRSLGVHLVLATQRPSGVVSPEIRANCSLRICLRTTDEAEARDVLGSALPAQLPADRPGRAWLRAGGAAPVLLQVARVSTPAPAGPEVHVRRRAWPPQSAPVAGGGRTDGTTDLARIAAAVGRRAIGEGLQLPQRPWLPPLPSRLTVADLPTDRATASPTVLRIGLLDVPDRQVQPPLEMDLAAGGGWLAVGGPRSGRSTALETVLTEAAAQLSPDELHVHVLDHGGGAVATRAAELPHTGTVVRRGDPHRSGRLLHRLAAELERRRAGDPPDQPLVLLLVDGYDSLAAELESGDPTGGAADLIRLCREGGAVGLTVALTADRAVPGSRLASAVRERLVLPLPDRTDYAVAGVPARAVPEHRPPGRALVGEDAVECQLASPRDTVRAWPPGTGGSAPVRVTDLPADPELPLPFPDARYRWLPVGPGGDEGQVTGVDLGAGGGLLVVGPPGSGRSEAVRAFGRHCRAGGARVLELAATPPGDDHDSQEHRVDRVDRGDVTGLRAWLAEPGPGARVVLADDVTSLPDAVADALAVAGGAPAGSPAGDAPASGAVLVIAAGSPAELAGSFRGPVAALRRSRTALLLRPGPGDAELLGLRVPRTPLPARPGSGWLLVRGEPTRVQVARRRNPREAA
ncbi:FtsK/SpoIIIE domain-containing protein [Modestobacter sp. SYSU DS0875]